MGWTLDLCEANAAAAGAVPSALAGGAGDPRRCARYAELRSYGRVPIAGGEHEFTVYGFRDLLEAHALDYIQFDTNRVGGISQARKFVRLAEAFSIPVVPHAGQMHNFHVVMASLNCPMAEFFPRLMWKWATSCSGISSTASRRRWMGLSICPTTCRGWESRLTRRRLGQFKILE